MTTVVTITEELDGDLIVEADANYLRRQYAAELADDGMIDASDDKIVRHVYDNNPDAPGLSVSTRS